MWGQILWGVDKVKVLLRGLSEIYLSCYSLFLQINSQKLLYLCYFVVLLRKITIHIQHRLWNLAFLRIRNRSSLCGFDRQKNPGKWLRQWKKVSMSRKQKFALCVREKNNSFEIIVIIFRTYKKCKSPIQREFLKGLLTNISFLLYFRDRPKMAKEKKRDVESVHVEEELNIHPKKWQKLKLR